MYLLDTNILSDLRRGATVITDWIRSTPSSQRFVSVISLGEIMRWIGLAATRDPNLSQKLAQWLEELQSDFVERTLFIDSAIALQWGKIAAGRTRGAPDALIAATAIARDLTLVTRNLRDFADLPVKLLNPWENS